MSGEEFQIVTRKKWIARKCLRRRDRHKSESDYLNDCPDVDVDKFQQYVKNKRLERLCAGMAQSDYFIMAMETMQQQMDVTLDKPLQRILCLGLGPFSRTHQALHQMAFILSAQRHYKIKEALYFDPVFRDSEKELIKRFNGAVMTDDCAGQHVADIPTLYYLPHCPFALMHNLLLCNWNITNLKNVLLISNSFEMLTLNKSLTKSNKCADHITKIIPFCTEVALDDDYEQHNVFNDLSLHTFPAKNLPASDNTCFWERCSPFKVQEDELLTEETQLETLNIS